MGIDPSTKFFDYNFIGFSLNAAPGSLCENEVISYELFYDKDGAGPVSFNETNKPAWLTLTPQNPGYSMHVDTIDPIDIGVYTFRLRAFLPTYPSIFWEDNVSELTIECVITGITLDRSAIPATVGPYTLGAAALSYAVTIAITPSMCPYESIELRAAGVPTTHTFISKTGS